MEGTLPEDTLLEGTLLEGTLLEGTLLEGTLLECTLLEARGQEEPQITPNLDKTGVPKSPYLFREAGWPKWPVGSGRARPSRAKTIRFFEHTLNNSRFAQKFCARAGGQKRQFVPPAIPPSLAAQKSGASPD